MNEQVFKKDENPIKTGILENFIQKNWKNSSHLLGEKKKRISGLILIPDLKMKARVRIASGIAYQGNRISPLHLLTYGY